MKKQTAYGAYGTETLEVISEAGRFNRWMYETIRPHCKGDILEIGSGIGNISRFFVHDGAHISLSDYDNSFLPGLQERFGRYPNLTGVYRIDLMDPDPSDSNPELIGRFDTVFALNVVEHIEDDRLAIKNAWKFLKPGGKIVLLVPAFPSLFNGFDKQLGHYRRYRPSSLKLLLESSGFRVIHSRFFNFIAIFGWFFFGNILREKIIPSGQMRIYDKLVPLWKWLDHGTTRIAGISVIQTGIKE